MIPGGNLNNRRQRGQGHMPSGLVLQTLVYQLNCEMYLRCLCLPEFMIVSVSLETRNPPGGWGQLFLICRYFWLRHQAEERMFVVARPLGGRTICFAPACWFLCLARLKILVFTWMVLYTRMMSTLEFLWNKPLVLVFTEAVCTHRSI